MLYNEIKYNNNGQVNGMDDMYMYLDERCNRLTKAENLNSYYQSEDPQNARMPDSAVSRDGNEFKVMSDGSVIWVRLMKNTRQLEVIRITG